jgi:hypothetical protein
LQVCQVFCPTTASFNCSRYRTNDDAFMVIICQGADQSARQCTQQTSGHSPGYFT